MKQKVSIMASLVKCFECGHELSSDAEVCPNFLCRTSSPHGYKCAVCCQIGRRSDFKGHYSYKHSDEGIPGIDKSIPGIFRVKVSEMHPTCFEKVEQEFKNSTSALHGYCPVCKNTFSYPSLDGPCPKCGHPKRENPDYNIIECSQCKMSLLESAAVYPEEGYPSHKTCAEKKPIEKEVIEKELRCFIATAVYGKGSDEVEYLRNFRDHYLYSTEIGRILISLYYIISPPIANLLVRKFILRTLLRIFVITPAYKILKIFVPLNKD